MAEAVNERSGHRKIFEHIESCSWCSQRLKAFLGHHLENKPPDYGPILDRSVRSLRLWEAEYASERATAPDLLSSLLNMPGGRQKMVLRNHRRFQTWGLLELLLSESRERVFDDAPASEDLATLGLELAHSLNSSHYGAERVEDLRARAMALIGNSRRVRFDLPGAELAFGEAYKHLAAGTRDSLERASILEFQASFRRLQRRFDDSLRLLRKAEVIFKEAEASHSVGRCQLQVSIVHHYRGEFDISVAVLRRAIPLINQTFDPRSLFFAWHNLISALVKAGHPILETQALLARARPLYQSFPQAWAQGRLKWIEGRIARRTGRDSEAMALLNAARQELLAANLEFEAGLVTEEMRGVAPEW
jgi:tetratricopeptide (TPR) repeat protein